MGTLHGAEAGQARSVPEHTVYAAVEVSRKHWVVALQAPESGGIGLHTIAAADTAALARLVEWAREALARERGARPRVRCAYEAGYEGFWLARRLAQLGIEPLVFDPASLPASRKARRAKTDRLDAVGMLRALLAFERGEPRAPSPVRVPSVAEEDRRRLLRERRRLVKQRTLLANAIQGLLMLHGVFDLDPRKKGFAERLDVVRTGYGTPLPPGLRAELRRTAALLAVVEGRVAEVEAERDRIVARAVSGAAPEGEGEMRAVSGAMPEDEEEMRARSGAMPEDDGGKSAGAGTAPVCDGGKWARSGAMPEDDGGSDPMIARLVRLRGVGGQRRHSPRPRGVLPRVPQPARARGLGGARACAVGERGGDPQPGHRQGRAAVAAGADGAVGVALVAAPAAERALGVVPRPRRGVGRAGAAGVRHRAGPQAAGGAVAVRDEGGRARGRGARLSR